MRKNLTPAAIGVLFLGTASGASAGVAIFSNSGGSHSQYNPSFSDRELFQIAVVGGGTLESVRIAPNHVDFFGGADPRSETGRLYIYADFGDTPDANVDLQPDQLLFEAEFVTGVLPGNTWEFLDIDATSANVTISPGAALWVGLEFDGGFRTRTSFEEIGQIVDTGNTWIRGEGFSPSAIGGFDEGDQAPVFDLSVVPAPATLVAAVPAWIFTRRRTRR